MKASEKVTIQLVLEKGHYQIDSAAILGTGFHDTGDALQYYMEETWSGPEAPGQAIDCLNALATSFRVSADHHLLRRLLDLCSSCIEFIEAPYGEMVEVDRYTCGCKQFGDLNFTATAVVGCFGSYKSYIRVFIDDENHMTPELLEKLIPETAAFPIHSELGMETDATDGITRIIGGISVDTPMLSRQALECYDIGNLESKLIRVETNGDERPVERLEELFGVPVTSFRIAITGTIGKTRRCVLGVYDSKLSLVKDWINARGTLIPGTARIDDAPVEN